MKLSRTMLWAMLILAALAGPLAHGAGNGVTLGNVSAAAKSNVIVPLMLELDSQEVRVGSLSATIGYNANVATFDRAEKGFLLDGVGGKIKATPYVDGEKSQVQVEITTEGEPGKPPRPLRKGLVLSLIFKINEKAAADTKMPLTLSAVRMVTSPSGDTEPKPIEPLTLTAGKIEVLAPENVPFVSCFFFTH